MSYLGIELGSTRIKSVVIDENGNILQSGSHTWESTLENGHWTYSLEDIQSGLRESVKNLDLSGVTAFGVSAMMHGYIALDRDDSLLTAFRTWKDETTVKAASKLTELFGFNIPLRWSIAHLYQAVLDDEPHVKDIAYLTTLAGYVHYRLTGEKVLGIGDASGMFPISNGPVGDKNYNAQFVQKFLALTGIDFTAIAPKVLLAGESAGVLTAEGCEYLGISRSLAGITMCPPEGDAGTGMVATNAIKPRTGNVSAGTSVFAMVVLEKPLAGVYPQIDIVTTPAGDDVAMVHCNECTSRIDPHIELFGEAVSLLGFAPDKGELYTKLYESALGNSKLSAYMRGLLVSAISDLSDGLKILTDRENVPIDSLKGHGGYFKSGKAGQIIMSETLGIPVTISATAAEGGAWGIALLAGFMESGAETLAKYLDNIV